MVLDTEKLSEAKIFLAAQEIRVHPQFERTVYKNPDK